MFANARIAVALLQQTLRRRFERQTAFLKARLSAEGLFGLHLTIGGVALIAGAWLFGGVVEDLITGDPLTVFDVVISDWFKDHATPSFTVWMARVSDLASPSAVLGLCIVGAMVLLWKRQWYALFALTLVVPGGIVLNLLLKDDVCASTSRLGQCRGVGIQLSERPYDDRHTGLRLYRCVLFRFCCPVLVLAHVVSCGAFPDHRRNRL